MMLPRYARFLAKSYLYLLALLTLSRAIAAAMVWENLDQESFTSIGYAFFMGWRFDNVIICAVLALPFLLLTVNQFIIRSQRLQKIGAWPLILMLPIIVLLQMVDLAYFDHFGIRITTILFNWLDDMSFVFRMIQDEPLWFIGGMFIPVLMWLFNYPLRLWNDRNFWHPLIGKSFVGWIFASVLILGLIFIGLRGRLAIKSPIREGTAFFSQNPVLNNLALNPTYTFFASWIRAKKYKEKPLRFMAATKAFDHVQRFHKFSALPQKHPLTRIMGTDKTKDWNVVLVIMEGMSAHYTRYKKNPSWTPTLDHLMETGIEFKQAYSAGLHTFNGIWSTLFSYPAPYTTHPLKRDVIPLLNSFSSQMNAKGIQTLFFTTHDDQFDNMAGFVRQNGFQKIIHQADYPPDRVLSILGVPDHDMFQHAIPLFTEADRKGRFFAAMLTGSNHKPHIIPPELKHRFNSKDEKENIVRYSDWAIASFLEAARGQPWGARTIFAFIADHGQAVGSDRMDQILSYHHVPFIIWSQGLIKPQSVSAPVMQVDVMPTLMGIWGGEWLNSTLGRDVLAYPRSWVYVGRDVTTCLLTSKEMDCESQDRDRTNQVFDAPFWDSTDLLDKHELWDIVHAELQLSDGILRERQTFP